MTVAIHLSDEELIEQALQALTQALGPTQTIRFLKLRSERLESVLRHRQWQETLDKKTFFDAVFAVAPLTPINSNDQY